MNLDAGGAQTFIASLAVEQKKLGHDVSIIVIEIRLGIFLYFEFLNIGHLNFFNNLILF